VAFRIGEQDYVPTEMDRLHAKLKSMGVSKFGHKHFLSLFQLRVDSIGFLVVLQAGPDIKNIL
jgi:hypothetical protein